MFFQIPPTQININLAAVLEWLKFIAYVIGGVTAVWKLSRFANKVFDEAKGFATDIRDFMIESRVHMTKMGGLGDLLVSNHLTHIETSLKKMADGHHQVRLTDEEEK